MFYSLPISAKETFYRVVPFVAMTVPPSLIALYGLTVFIVGAVRFWRETQGPISALIDPAALWRATKDAFGLAYMKGGGAGCNYPAENFSRSRMWYHHLVFYGFLLDFAATSIAAFYDHFLGWQAPYPYFSAPVVLGTVGGIGLLIGTVGLLYLKWKSDRAPADSTMLNMDVAFLVLLFLDQLHRTFAASVPRNPGDGNAAGHSFRMWSPDYSLRCPTESSPTWFTATLLWCAIPSSSAALTHILRKVARRSVQDESLSPFGIAASTTIFKPRRQRYRL